MKTLSDNLSLYFQNAEKLHLIHRVSLEKPVTNCITSHNLIAYLNPIHPYPIHIIGINELTYFKTLSNTALKELINQLSANGAQYLIFENQNTIPDIFFQQDLIHLVISNHPTNNLLQRLSHDINESIAERVSQHGAFVVIFNQGILITGESGSGKSSLLLDLVKQGHLWIADDLILFFLDANSNTKTNNPIIGHASGELSEFVHVKGIGPINMDKTHGQASRIRRHSLAGVVHLSNNSTNENPNISAYTQTDSLEIFNRTIPMWHLPTTHPNLSTMVENCAKNLILNDWDYNAINGLENALNNALTTSNKTAPKPTSKPTLKPANKPPTTRPA